MLDLTKPIRRRDDKRPARVLTTDLPGRWTVCVAWQSGLVDGWCSSSFKPDGLDDFENVPPPQEWRWETPKGYIFGAIYDSAEEARAAEKGAPGQPIRILREGETP